MRRIKTTTALKLNEKNPLSLQTIWFYVRLVCVKMFSFFLVVVKYRKYFVFWTNLRKFSTTNEMWRYSTQRCRLTTDKWNEKIHVSRKNYGQNIEIKSKWWHLYSDGRRQTKKPPQHSPNSNAKNWRCLNKTMLTHKYCSFFHFHFRFGSFVVSFAGHTESQHPKHFNVLSVEFNEKVVNDKRPLDCVIVSAASSAFFRGGRPHSVW